LLTFSHSSRYFPCHSTRITKENFSRIFSHETPVS
jgi:hypothetical protein